MTGWTIRSLGDLTVNLDRRRVPVRGSARKPGPYAYYGASGIVDWVDGYLFEGLYLLIAEDGENLRSRKTPIAFLADGKFWVNNHAHILVANESNDIRFLAYAMQAADISGYITGSAQPKLNQAALSSIKINTPPLPTQRRIAATLGALDDKIESNRRAIDLIEGLVASHFSRRFSAEPSEAGIPISELVDVNPRRSLAKGKITTYIGMASLPEKSMSIWDWDSRAFGSGQRFINGDVLMARITPCLENGKTAVVDMLADGDVAWGSTEYIVLAPRGNISTPWIYSLVRSEPVRSYVIRGMSGTSGRQRFAASSFDQYRVAAPDESDLCEFNALGIPLFKRAASLRDECRALTSLRDTLLPELLSGRIRVPVEVAA